MASHYNSRPGAAQIMVDGVRFAIVKPRLEPSAQFADERVPSWLDRTDGTSPVKESG